MTKKLITEVASDIKRDLHCRTIADAIIRLKELASKYGEDAVIDIGQEYAAYSDDQYAFVRLTIDRPETNAEYEKRMADEKHWEDCQRAADLEAYERVKKSMDLSKASKL